MPTQQPLDGFTQFLARAGLRLTRQREAIARAFFASRTHLGAEELYRRLHAQESGIGLVTVYRTLKLLRQAGLASERRFGDAYARFDPQPSDWSHHHLICTRCGQVQEFQETTLQGLRRTVARRTGFTVLDQKLELYGLCRRCAGPARGNGQGTRPRPTP